MSNQIFWKKISNYILIGFITGMLTALGQQYVLAEEDNCLDGNEFSCPEPGGGGEGEELPLPDYPTPYTYPTPEYTYPTPEYPTPEYPTPAPEYTYPTPDYPTPAPSYTTPPAGPAGPAGPQGAPGAPAPAAAAPAAPSFNISNTNENTNNNTNNNSNTTTVTNDISNQNANSSSSTSSSSSNSTNNTSVSVTQQPQGGVAAAPQVRQVAGAQPAVLAAAAQPQVVRVAGAAPSQVQELPKTGLPLLAWAAGAFIPAGLGLKKFGKKIVEDMVNHPQFMFEERQFKKI